MNNSKFLLIGSLAFVGALFVPSAQADDHGRHRNDRHDDRREYRSHHHDYNRGYRGQSNYYYNNQPGVVYGSPYYGDSGVVIALGGHRHHRHHHHD